jgi:aerobic carbon-monoxide dehydrogenase medium subunit
LYLKDFTYHRPKTINEACLILERSKDGAAIAGGTDVLVEFKKGLRQTEDIVSLIEIKELKTIAENDNGISIGACATHNEVYRSSLIRKKFPAVSEAASKIGTDQIRNTATIGGNLCTGASCCDMAPVLIAVNASVEITGSSLTRVVSLKDFFIFHKETAMKKGEIMTKIIIPFSKPGQAAGFEKFGLRESASISVASVSVRLNTDGDICTESCIVIGAVAPTPKICSKAMDILKGKKIKDLTENSELLISVGEAAVKESLPLDDIRGSAGYRRHLINILTQRALVKAANRLIKSL